MHENGFFNIPKPYGINAEGKEMVSFVEGEVYNDSLPDMILTDEVLVDVAKLLRCYHDVGEKYMQRLTGEEVWMLPKHSPQEVMCHGDFAPYNLTFVDGSVHGIIDFDTLHPGPRLWDIAYAVYPCFLLFQSMCAFIKALYISSLFSRLYSSAFLSSFSVIK